MKNAVAEILFKDQCPSLFEQFGRMKPRLRATAFEAAWFLLSTSGQLLLITHILRLHKEQDEIYGHLPEYQAEPWRSPHEFFNAWDGSVACTIDTKHALVTHINNHFVYDVKRPTKKTMLLHEVKKADGTSRGEHLHAQIWEG